MKHNEPIFTEAETAGLSIFQIVRKASARYMRMNHPPPYGVGVSPEAWESLLVSMLEDNRPLKLEPSADGNSARIVLFISGARVEIVPHPDVTRFNDVRWSFPP